MCQSALVTKMLNTINPFSGPIPTSPNLNYSIAQQLLKITFRSVLPLILVPCLCHPVLLSNLCLLVQIIEVMHSLQAKM